MHIEIADLEISNSAAGALRRSSTTIWLVQKEAEDVEQEHYRHDEQVGEQALKIIINNFKF